MLFKTAATANDNAAATSAEKPRKEKWQGPPTAATCPRVIGRDLELIKTARHGIAGVDLILGYSHLDKKYIIGWAAPWQITLRDYQMTSSAASARMRYAFAARSAPPVNAATTRDYQRNDVYWWEEDTTDKDSPLITPAQMQQTANKICRDFNLSAAPVTYKAPRDPERPTSLYYPTQDKIKMGHQTLSALLHELAHKIDDQVNGNVWAAHGPSFVRTLLLLAERHQYWVDIKNAEERAAEFDLVISPRDIPAARFIR